MSRNFWKGADTAPPFDYSVRGPRDIFGGGDTAPAPDYTPMANASAEAARIAAELGREQIAEAKRQYDQNVEFGRPIAEAQRAIMEQTRDQGADYYQYMQDTFRPLERKMVGEADIAGSEAEQERAASRAIADARRGSTAMQNQLIRQGLRYGYSPSAMAAKLGSGAMQTGTAVAAAGNQARDKEKAVGWAKKMDAAGLGRGLPGASQGAYGLAVNAGTAANQGQMAPGQAYMAGMGQGAGTTMQGRGMQIQGLGSMLSSQTSSYNAGLQQDSGGGLGSLIGMGVGLYGKSMGIPGLKHGGAIPMVEGPDGEYSMSSEHGGEFHGPGHGTSDSIPARNKDSGQAIAVSTGEYVIPADVVQRLGTEHFDRMVKKFHKPAIARA